MAGGDHEAVVYTPKSESVPSHPCPLHPSHPSLLVLSHRSPPPDPRPPCSSPLLADHDHVYTQQHEHEHEHDNENSPLLTLIKCSSVLILKLNIFATALLRCSHKSIILDIHTYEHIYYRFQFARWLDVLDHWKVHFGRMWRRWCGLHWGKPPLL